MKKLVLIAITFCMFQMVSAQGPHHGKKGMDLSAEEMANLQTKKMTLALDLTTEQQDDIYKLNLENAKLKKTHMAERKARKDSGDATKPTKEERLKRMNNMLDHKIAVKAKMKDILNDEQYARWEKMAAKRHAKMKEKAKNKRAKRKA